MVPLYALLTLTAAALKGLLAARAAGVERKYAKAAKEAESVAGEVKAKPSTDPFAQAKSHYELGRLVETRDALEAKSLAWHGRAEKAAAVLAKLRGWNGRLVPYLMGVVDVGLLFAALHYLGLPHGLTATGVEAWAKGFGG